MSKLLRVSRTSDPSLVAGAIAHILRETEEVEMRAIGPTALYQGIQAIALARSYLERDGYDIAAKPSCIDLDLGGLERTAVQFLLYRVPRSEEEQPTVEYAYRSIYSHDQPNTSDYYRNGYTNGHTNGHHKRHYEEPYQSRFTRNP